MTQTMQLLLAKLVVDEQSNNYYLTALSLSTRRRCSRALPVRVARMKATPKAAISVVVVVAVVVIVVGAHLFGVANANECGDLSDD